MRKNLSFIYWFCIAICLISVVFYFHAEKSYSRLEGYQILLEKCAHKAGQAPTSLPDQCRALDKLQNLLKSENLLSLLVLTNTYSGLIETNDQGQVSSIELQNLNTSIELVLHDLDSIIYQHEKLMKQTGKTFLITLFITLILSLYYIFIFLGSGREKSNLKAMASEKLLQLTHERVPELAPYLDLQTSLANPELLKTDLFMEIYGNLLMLARQTSIQLGSLEKVSIRLFEKDTELSFKVDLCFLSPFGPNYLDHVIGSKDYQMVRVLTQSQGGTVSLTGNSYFSVVHLELYLPWVDMEVDKRLLLQA